MLINVDYWHGECETLEEAAFGAASIHKTKRKKGGYQIGKFSAINIGNPFISTVLKIENEKGKKVEWMSDEPHDDFSITDDLNLLSPGSVMLGGLGLGIHLRKLAGKYPQIKKIVVVENNADVIALIKPTLPKDKRVKIIFGDFYEEVEKSKAKFDNYHWDCFHGGSEVSDQIKHYIRMIRCKTENDSSCRMIFHGLTVFNSY